MLANHLDVAEPVSPVVDGAIVLRVHDEGRCELVKLMTALDRAVDVFDLLLALNPANNHLFDDGAGGFCMSVDTVGALLLDESVATVVELGNVAAHIFNQREFATRVLPLIAV